MTDEIKRASSAAWNRKFQRAKNTKGGIFTCERSTCMFVRDIEISHRFESGLGEGGW